MQSKIELLKFINEQIVNQNKHDFYLPELSNKFSLPIKSVREILKMYTSCGISTEEKVVVVSIKEEGLTLIK